MVITTSTIFSKVKEYIKFGQRLQAHLSKHPDDWHKFQDTFNLTLDNVYNDMLLFEKENIGKDESKVYKLQKIFEKRYRHFFLCGTLIKWCFDKPYGYSGDFKIIDDIYQNQPISEGFARLWDNWFQQLTAAKSVRERKGDFKKLILEFVQKHKGENLSIMNLASGPAREIKELLENDSEKLFSQTTFDCYDLEMRALEYAKQLLNNYSNINFSQKNAIRLALKKDIKEEICCNYDLIYSTGLFDYLDERIAVKLVGNLKKLLKPGAIMIIANAADKYSNSSAAWMEWAVDWYLIYRTESEFKKIFLDAGFSDESLQIILQQNNVMQYCIAKSY